MTDLNDDSKGQPWLVVAVGLILFLAAFLALHWPASSPERLQGVVISRGAVSVARIKGGTQESASIRLETDEVVIASVEPGIGPLQSGENVSVLMQSRLLGGPVYRVISRTSAR